VRPDRARSDGESFKHVGVRYDSDAALPGLIAPRIREALAEGRRVLAIAGAAKLALLDRALGEGARLIERRSPGAWYAHPHRAAAAFHEYTRGRRTLIVGEQPWHDRSERGQREWIRCESMLNAALGDTTTTMLCLYDRRAVPEPVLAYEPMTHPLLLDGSGEAVSSSFVQPRELVLNGDRAPLPAPSGHVVTVRFTARGLRQLRHTINDYARLVGMKGDLVGSFVLSVSEIAANSVEHGAGHGEILLWVSDGELICEVVDTGGALDDPLPGYIPPEPESQRGYGLWISRQLCDLVELRASGGTLRVRLHMSLDHEH
jgi:anti-sigma regulatory factor (Ser/Thr protein kinase)